MVKKTAAFRQRRAADTARWRERLHRGAAVYPGRGRRHYVLASDLHSGTLAPPKRNGRPKRGATGRPSGLHDIACRRDAGDGSTSRRDRLITEHARTHARSAEETPLPPASA